MEFRFGHHLNQLPSAHPVKRWPIAVDVARILRVRGKLVSAHRAAHAFRESCDLVDFEILAAVWPVMFALERYSFQP